MLHKTLFQAGLQCAKRMYLESHRTESRPKSEAGKMLAECGRRLVELARTAFPRGIAVEGDTVEQRVARTAELLEQEHAVLFGAAFLSEDVFVETDILLRQRDGSLDIYEVKTGAGVQIRYLQDLALQVFAIEAAGYSVRNTFVLHVNPLYSHVEGQEYPVQKLLKSADVTRRVRRQIEHVPGAIAIMHKQIEDEGSLELPVGTWCRRPLPCPHFDDCAQQSPAHPLLDLPDISREQEAALHTEGIETIPEIDPARAGLSRRQRQTVRAVREGKAIVEDFVGEELRQIDWPLHLVAVASVKEPLPRFSGQRPWHPLFYAWAARTLHRNGTVSDGFYVHADKGDPRPSFTRSLAEFVSSEGTLMCWKCDPLMSLRLLLGEVPDAKPVVRSLLARPHFDLAALFDSGVFHPALTGSRSIEDAARALLGREPPQEFAVRDDDDILAALRKAWTPRTRASTKAKIEQDVAALLRWRVEVMLDLYRDYSGFAPEGAGGAEERDRAFRKPLPRRAEPKY